MGKFKFNGIGTGFGNFGLPDSVAIKFVVVVISLLIVFGVIMLVKSIIEAIKNRK